MPDMCKPSVMEMKERKKYVNCNQCEEDRQIACWAETGFFTSFPLGVCPDEFRTGCVDTYFKSIEGIILITGLCPFCALIECKAGIVIKIL